MVFLLLAALFWPLPSIPGLGDFPRIAGSLEDAAHPAIFFYFGYQLFRREFFRVRPERPIPWLPYLFLLGAGAASELLQNITGRDASLIDACNDMLGATAALCVRLLSDSGRLSQILLCRRWLKAILAVCCLLWVGPVTFVALSYAHRATQIPLLWNSRSLLDQGFLVRGSRGFPGYHLQEPWPDWRGHRQLKVEIRETGMRIHTVWVRVRDQDSYRNLSETFNASYVLQPDETLMVTIPLTQIAAGIASKPAALTDIADLAVFEVSDASSPGFRILAIRLE